MDLHGWLYPTIADNAKELQNVLLKYNYAHLVTNCWFGCWNFSTFDAFACSLGKPIQWNLNFEIYFEFVSTFFIRNFQK